MKRGFLIFFCVILPGGMAMNAQAEETTLDFFKGLNFEDGIIVVVDVFRRFPLQYATTLGLDCREIGSFCLFLVCCREWKEEDAS